MEMETDVLKGANIMEGENSKPHDVGMTTIDLTESPSCKKPKLKQARLPFKVLSPKAAIAIPLITTPTQKKRKLSDSHPGPQKLAKTPKNDENSPKCPPIQRKVTCALSAENEVSSSSEADSSSKVKLHIDLKPKSVGTLEKFVRTTQQLEVTTSNIDDDVSSDNETEVKEDVKKSTEVEDTEVNNRDKEVNNRDTETDKKENSVNSKVEAEDKQSPNKDAKTDDSQEKTPTKQNNTPESEKQIKESDSCENNTSETPLPKATNEQTPSSKVTNELMPSPKATNQTPARIKSPPSSVMKNSIEKNKKKEIKNVEKIKEREKVKEEKEKQKQEIKDKKEQERLDAKRKKDEEKLKKDEEKQKLLEQKQKEKDEKQKELDEKKKQKEEERLKKEEERIKKEEERIKKEEEKKKKQDIISAKNEDKKKKEEEKQRTEDELKMKKEKEKRKFTKFFTKTEKQIIPPKLEEKKGLFIAFEVKLTMRLAPVRVHEDLRTVKMTNLDHFLTSNQECTKLYLDEIKEKSYKRGHMGKTWPYERDEDVLIVSEITTTYNVRAKLLQFRENYRPAYYGSWRKRSEVITPRRPLAMDKVLFDYEVESDDEWEEEEPGESLSNSEGEGTDDEKDKDEDEGDGDGDGFFVPHGYLSEGEGCEDEEDDVSPERLKARQLAKAKAWEAAMKENKLKVLKPVCIGCLWADIGATLLQQDPNWLKLQQYAAVPLVATPIQTSQPISSQSGSPTSDKAQKKPGLMPVPEEAMTEVIRLVHGNMYGVPKLVKEFREYWRRKSLGLELVNTEDLKAKSNQSEAMDVSQDEDMIELEKSDTNKPKLDDKTETEQNQCTISKRQLAATIKNIACYEKQSSYHRKCWFVKAEVLEKYEMKDLPVPTPWHWLTRSNILPKKVIKETVVQNTPKIVPQPGKMTPNIKQFAVAGYTPPVVIPSPKPHTPKTTGLDIKQFTIAGYVPPVPSPKASLPKTPKVGISTPKVEKPSNNSETPKRMIEPKDITPSNLFSQSPGQRSVKSMFTPSPNSVAEKKNVQQSRKQNVPKKHILDKSPVLMIDKLKSPEGGFPKPGNPTPGNYNKGNLNMGNPRPRNPNMGNPKPRKLNLAKPIPGIPRPGDSADMPMELD